MGTFLASRACSSSWGVRQDSHAPRTGEEELDRVLVVAAKRQPNIKQDKLSAKLAI